MKIRKNTSTAIDTSITVELSVDELVQIVRDRYSDQLSEYPFISAESDLLPISDKIILMFYLSRNEGSVEDV